MKIINALLIGAILIYSYSSFARTSQKNIVEKDNSALNKREVITAETQARGTVENIEVTRQLREMIMADERLSTNAKNIKIITVGEIITLSGPVLNKKEKQKIEKMARKIDHTKKVHNNLLY
jgi:osmotically-inducible protein OsmY